MSGPRIGLRESLRTHYPNSYDQTVLEALDLRRLLESKLLSLAVGRLQPRALASILGKLDAMGNSNPETAVRLYQEAHLTLYQSEPAKKIMALAEPELQATRPLLVAYLATRQGREAFNDYFRALLAAVLQGESELALGRFHEHLNDLLQGP